MFGFTRQERQVILFLITVALVGMGVSFLAKRYSQVKAIACINQDIGKIDLNKADKETLIGIPGIGEKLAQRIIDYRNQQAGFKDAEELKNIKGISDYKYEKLKDLLFIQ